MRRVLHGCGTGVVIAKGGCGRDVRCDRSQGRIVWIGFQWCLRGIHRTWWEVRVSARVAADANTPETPDPDRQGPAGFDAASGPLRFRVQDRFWECSRDTPATFAAGTPGVEAGDSKSRESVQGLPK